MMGFDDFEAFLKVSFPDVTEEMVERFRLMDSGYRDWNAKINVISRKDIDSLYDHHVLHSLAIAEYLRTQRPEIYSLFTASSSKGSEPVASTGISAPQKYTSNIATAPSPTNASQTELRVLDLGTGGGFPGIPLAVMFPHVKFTLCDSVGKFDFIVSRAVASLTDFYPWVKGKYSRSILYLKGGDINEEICDLMSRERLRKGTVSTWPVTSWLSAPYFDGKFVIDISR